MAKAAAYAPGTPAERKCDIRVIDAEAVKTLKTEYMQSPWAAHFGVKYLSTNDLVTAGCAELADDDHSVGLMFANMRNRLDGVSSNVVGNFERGIPYPANLAANNPAFIRHLATDFEYYNCDGREKFSSMRPGGPAEAWKQSNIVAQTNWSSLQLFLEPEGTSVVAHLPFGSFVKSVAGFDIAIIFAADTKGTLAVMNNFCTGKRGEEMQDTIAQSQLFSRLFGLAAEGQPMTAPGAAILPASAISQLREYKKLTDEGCLTDDEFAALKARVLHIGPFSEAIPPTKKTVTTKTTPDGVVTVTTVYE